MDNLTTLVCECCKKEYWTRKDRAHLSRFCSNSCWGKTCGGSKFEDLTGKVFGRWLVVGREINTKQGSAQWSVICECGRTTILEARTLRSGRSQSCGCLRVELQREAKTTHGMSRNKTFRCVYGRQYRDRKHQLDKWLPEHQSLLLTLQKSCVVCHSVSDLAVDHVLPLSKGFGLMPGNAVVLCKRCNSSKSDRDLADLPLDWQQKIVAAAKEFEEAWQQV